MDSGLSPGMALAMAVTWVEDTVGPHYAWFQSDVVPQMEKVVPELMNVWDQMDVPAWDVYSVAMKNWGADIVNVSQSTGQLAWLTFKPIFVLLSILGQLLFRVANLLFQLLLAKAFVSLQHTLMQAKAAIIWLYFFQVSLSKEEIMVEIAICGSMVLLYYFRQWLRRQTYYARATRWYRRKKRAVFSVSNSNNNTRDRGPRR